MNVLRVCTLAALLAAAAFGGVTACSNAAVNDVEKVDIAALPPSQQVFELAARGKLDELKALINADPKLLTARGNYEWTLLHYAAAYGQNAVVKYLLEQGADPKAADENSYEPAAIAAQRRHTDTAKIIRDVIVGAANQ